MTTEKQRSTYVKLMEMQHAQDYGVNKKFVLERFPNAKAFELIHRGNTWWAITLHGRQPSVLERSPFGAFTEATAWARLRSIIEAFEQMKQV